MASQASGLTFQEAKVLQEKHGLNEVTTAPVPEWKKLGKRYLDWISIIIVINMLNIFAVCSHCCRAASEVFLVARACSLTMSFVVPTCSASSCCSAQIIAAVFSAAVPSNGGRGWTSFVLLIIELNLICLVGWYSERNAGNAVKELEVTVLANISTLTLCLPRRTLCKVCSAEPGSLHSNS